MEVETGMPRGSAPSQFGGQKSPDADSQIKGQGAGLGRMAADRIDESRAAAARGLDNAANALHERADALPGGPKVASAAHAAADGLASGAEYVQDHDVKSMAEDLQRLIKRNPGVALLGAAVLGFLVARTFSRG